MSMPVMVMNSSMKMWCTEPTPAEAKVKLAGLALGERDQLLTRS